MYIEIHIWTFLFPVMTLMMLVVLSNIIVTMLLLITIQKSTTKFVMSPSAQHPSPILILFLSIHGKGSRKTERYCLNILLLIFQIIIQICSNNTSTPKKINSV